MQRPNHDPSRDECNLDGVGYRDFTGEDERTFVASDGYQFWYRHYRAHGPARAYVVALHGVQSHSGWYAYSSQFLARQGIDVRFLDRRGSGMNDRDRGHAEHPDRLVNDVRQFLLHVRHERDREHPQAPVVLLGLSWGGRLAATCAARYPHEMDALCLLYPGIFARVRPSFWQRWLLDRVVRLGQTRLPRDIPLDDPLLFTSVPKWQEFIASDPLALHTATLGLLDAGQKLAEEAAAGAAAIRCPLLLMLAAQDRIIDNAATLRWLQRTGSRQRTDVLYPNAAHTLEFEADREHFVEDLSDWILWQAHRQSRPHALAWRT